VAQAVGFFQLIGVFPAHFAAVSQKSFNFAG
jgi:hypothetical protein